MHIKGHPYVLNTKHCMVHYLSESLIVAIYKILTTVLSYLVAHSIASWLFVLQKQLRGLL